MAHAHFIYGVIYLPFNFPIIIFFKYIIIILYRQEIRDGCSTVKENSEYLIMFLIT